MMVADFYKDRTLSLVVGHEVGTGFDTYARVLARHIGRHMPGNPAIVVQNMVGASGIAAANWLYNVAPKDGTVVSTFVQTTVFDPIFGNAVAKFDAGEIHLDRQCRRRCRHLRRGEGVRRPGSRRLAQARNRSSAPPG